MFGPRLAHEAPGRLRPEAVVAEEDVADACDEDFAAHIISSLMYRRRSPKFIAIVTTAAAAATYPTIFHVFIKSSSGAGREAYPTIVRVRPARRRSDVPPAVI